MCAAFARSCADSKNYRLVLSKFNFVFLYFYFLSTHFSISHCDPAGHKGYRGGISSSSPHGLPSWPPSAHARLLAERQSRPTQIRPDRRHPRQDDPQSQHFKNADGDVYAVRTPIRFLHPAIIYLL